MPPWPGWDLEITEANSSPNDSDTLQSIDIYGKNSYIGLLNIYPIFIPLFGCQVSVFSAASGRRDDQFDQKN